MIHRRTERLRPADPHAVRRGAHVPERRAPVDEPRALAPCEVPAPPVRRRREAAGERHPSPVRHAHRALRMRREDRSRLRRRSGREPDFLHGERQRESRLSRARREIPDQHVRLENPPVLQHGPELPLPHVERQAPIPVVHHRTPARREHRRPARPEVRHEDLRFGPPRVRKAAPAEKRRQRPRGEGPPPHRRAPPSARQRKNEGPVVQRRLRRGHPARRERRMRQGREPSVQPQRAPERVVRALQQAARKRRENRREKRGGEPRDDAPLEERRHKQIRREEIQRQPVKIPEHHRHREKLRRKSHGRPLPRPFRQRQPPQRPEKRAVQEHDARRRPHGQLEAHVEEIVRVPEKHRSRRRAERDPRFPIAVKKERRHGEHTHDGRPHHRRHKPRQRRVSQHGQRRQRQHRPFGQAEPAPEQAEKSEKERHMRS